MAPPKKTIRAPILAADLEPRVVSALDGAEVEAARVEALSLAEARADQVRFDGVRIVAGTLSGTRVKHLSWTDVAGERCDLSLAEWPGAKLLRVELRGCRLTGAKFFEGEFDSVRFIDCQLDYASFAEARFRQASFEECRLKEADFTRADLAGTTFVKCDATGADFTRAKLQGVDVASTTLRDVRLEPGDVRGLVVNPEQAAVLARLFGLVVRDA